MSLPLSGQAQDDIQITPSPKPQHTIKANIPYGSDDLQTLDVYIPDSAKKGSFPVHIFVHGGAWQVGDKSYHKDQGLFNNDNGIIFVAINYRLLPKHKHPAQVEDTARAVKWVYDNIAKYGGDPFQIHISGHSAGAHIAALLATDPTYLNLYGLSPTIFRSVMAVDTASFDLTVPPEGKDARTLKKNIAKNFGTTPEELQAASPLYHAQQQNTSFPRFVLFVTSRRPDAVAQTKAFNTALGRVSEMRIIKGYSHEDMVRAMAIPSTSIAKTILKVILG